MKVLFDGEVFVHYGFIRLRPEDALDDELTAARGGQTNGLCGGAYPGVLVMTTGLHTGMVPVRVELHEAAPAVGDEWEDVVEVPLEVTAEDYLLAAFDWFMQIEAPAAGSYRARWCATGMDEARDGTRWTGDPERDRYLLQLWRAPLAPDVVVRQGSDNARYWHGVAAKTPAPPPPPTPEMLAEERAEARRAELAAAVVRRAAREAEDWGGRPPTDELRAIGGRSVQLARVDRDLVDHLASMPAEDQRLLAVWAARRACDVAGISDVPAVQAAVRAAGTGGPLPRPWEDWGATWELLVPSSGEVVAEIRILTAEEPLPLLDPVAVAIDAVREAGEANPARAVMGALDALACGHEDRRAFFEELRHQLTTGALPFR